MSSAEFQASSAPAAPSYVDSLPPPSHDDDLPSHITAEKDPTTERTYYLNHDTKTTSWLHPSNKPFTEGLPWPWERRIDDKGRAYYLDHEHSTSTWLDPVKQKKFQQDGKLDDDIYKESEGGHCVVEEKTVDSRKYWVNYSIGEVSGPDDELERKMTTA